MNPQAESDLVARAWPQARAAEALQALARAAGLGPRAPTTPARTSREGPSTLDARLRASAEACALEVEAVETPFAETDALLARVAPALIGIEGPAGEPRLVALLRGGRRACLLGPDGRRAPCDLARLAALWRAPHERPLEALVTPVLDSAGLQGPARARARRALIREHFAAVPVGTAWILRLPPDRALRASARGAGLVRLALGIGLSGLAASALALGAWIPFGRGVLSGSFEPAWFAAWALLFLGALPLRWLEGWMQSLFGLRFGLFLRRRLMAGATRLDPQRVRGEGAGALLGRVLDSEALEALLLGGGFVLVGAGVDVALATWALTHGPAPILAPGLFALWLGLALALWLGHLSRSRRQADARLAMTHDLVERMQGQRTRVVQEPAERRHQVEDAYLERYLARSRELDRSTVLILSLVGGGWLVAGISALAPAFVAGSTSPTGLAVGLGAVLLGQQALARLASGLLQLSACVVAWRQVRPVYRAAADVEDPGLPRAALLPAATEGAAARLEARALAYRYPGRERAALSAARFALASGDRVLLEGPSGGGKSTLVSLLAGWRTATSGALLLNGLDRASQGAARWRRRVAVAPQFHENHVFTGTLGFNLTLSAPEGVAEERVLAVCRELGLDALIARMPSGLRQVVGETGWQLSHGEKSRLFVARALLAEAPLVVLDESLAALDPETAGQVLGCVRQRADALLLVAHP